MSKKVIDFNEQTEEAPLVVNFEKWSYRDVSEYFAAYNRADVDKLNAILLKNMDVDASELDIEASTKLKYDVLIAMNGFVEGMPYDDVKVDFKRAKWTDKNFSEYRAASARGDVASVERLLKEVCILEGVDPQAGLNARQGCKMAQAIVKSYRDMLTGKF